MPFIPPTYGYLYIVCDASECPPVSDVMQKEIIEPLCYEAHCRDHYPAISIRDWMYDRTEHVTAEGEELSSVYEFHHPAR